MTHHRGAAVRVCMRPLMTWPAAAFLAASWFASGATAQPAATIRDPAQPAPSVAAVEPENAHRKAADEAWRAKVLATPAPKNGCFKVTQPDDAWVEVPCAKAPPLPQQPRSRLGPSVAGNGVDRSAQVADKIRGTTGSFDSVTGLFREVQSSGDEGLYALQLNTNTFSTNACSNAATPKSCIGWEQFIYSFNLGSLSTQYWLLGYGSSSCPANWASDGQGNCIQNAPNSVAAPKQPVTGLGKITLSASAVSGGSDTAAIFFGDGTAYVESNPDSDLGLSQGWTASEFNVFGDCCLNQANFNSGTSITVRTQVDHGTVPVGPVTTAAPTCLSKGFTGETNNLTISDPCTTLSGVVPAIVFTESIPPLSDPGSLWRSTFDGCVADGCHGWAQVDENPSTSRIAAGGDKFYQLHQDGQIWRWSGADCFVGCTGWELLDDNNGTAQIAAAGSTLFQLHKNGQIWAFTGAVCSGAVCPGWQMLDDNPAAVTISATPTALYQLHKDGTIWKYTGTPCNGTACPGWQMLDDNAAAVAIAAADGNLYQLHDTGRIWRYTGVPCNGSACSGWQMLDDNGAALAIAAGGDSLYQLHDTGRIWKYTGTPCNGDACPGWQMLDDNPAALSISAGGNNLFELHDTGKIWIFTGVACSGDSCPGWQEFDENPKTGRIAASETRLYQLHGDRTAPTRTLSCYECLRDPRFSVTGKPIP